MQENVPEGDLPAGVLPLEVKHLPFQPCLKTRKATAMEEKDKMKATRIAVLKSVVNDEYDGVQARVADVLEVQPGYFSRVLKGQKGLSGDLARTWEKKLGKPEYYLDGKTSGSAHASKKDESAIREAPPKISNDKLVNIDELMEWMSLFRQIDAQHRKRLMTLGRSLIKGKVRVRRPASNKS